VATIWFKADKRDFSMLAVPGDGRSFSNVFTLDSISDARSVMSVLADRRWAAIVSSVDVSD